MGERILPPCLFLFASVFVKFSLSLSAATPVCLSVLFSLFKQQRQCLECRSFSPSAEIHGYCQLLILEKINWKYIYMLLYKYCILFQIILTGNELTRKSSHIQGSLLCIVLYRQTTWTCLSMKSASRIHKTSAYIGQLHFLCLPPCFLICSALAGVDQCLHSFQVNLGSVLDMAVSLHTSFLSVSPTQGRRQRDREGERK